MESVNPLNRALLAAADFVRLGVRPPSLGRTVVADAIGFAVTSFGMGVATFRDLFTRSHADLPMPHKLAARHCVLRAATDLSAAPANDPLSGRGNHRQHTTRPAGMALYRWLPSGSSVWHPVWVINAILAVTNLVPFQARVGNAVLRTDGGQILTVLRDRVISVPAPQVIQTLKTFRGLWQSIRNHTMLRLYILASAALSRK